jgi:hypothetical protein
MVVTTAKPTMESTLIKDKSVRLDPGIAERIERLGELNDSYKRALGARDKKTLLDVAKRYQEIGCPRLASTVRRQARSC